MASGGSKAPSPGDRLEGERGILFILIYYFLFVCICGRVSKDLLRSFFSLWQQLSGERKREEVYSCSLSVVCCSV